MDKDRLNYVLDEIEEMLKDGERSLVKYDFHNRRFNRLMNMRDKLNRAFARNPFLFFNLNLSNRKAQIDIKIDEEFCAMRCENNISKNVLEFFHRFPGHFCCFK